MHGSWVDADDETRRVELLRRLNQISAKKTQLERQSSAPERDAKRPATARAPRRSRFNDAPAALARKGGLPAADAEKPAQLDVGAAAAAPLDKLDLMANDTKSSPPPHARGPGRVRTPSVLVSSQPGELLRASVTAYKNQQLSYCMRIVKDMLRLKDAFAFSKPIDRLWSRDQLPGYFEMISTPMDLGTVKHRLEAGSYLIPTPGGGPMDATFDADAYSRDMRLIFNNALTYNRPGDTFYDAATKLLEKFETKFKVLPNLNDMPVEPKKSKKRKKSSGFAGDRRRNAENRRRKAAAAAAKKGKTEGDSPVGAVKKDSAPKTKKATQSKSAAAKRASKSPTALKKRYDDMTLGELNSRLRLLEVKMNNRASSPVGANLYGAQAEALYDVPMTYEDKVKLSENVGKLPADKLQKLVALASKDKNSSMEVNNNEEIELDIDGMNNETLRDMEAFVNHTLYNRRGGSGPNADIGKMSKDELREEASKLSGIFQARKNRANGKRANGSSAAGNDGDAPTKSLYDSDSSSDSDDSSGSSGDSSSEEDSDSSGDEDHAETMRKRRERNLAHQQAMKAAGTPLQSPAYR